MNQTQVEFEARGVVRCLKEEPIEQCLATLRAGSERHLKALCPVAGAALTFYAVQRKNDEEARRIVELLCDELKVCDATHLDRNRQTALFFAARDGNASTVRYFLERGCRPDQRDAAGQSALFYAARDGRTEVVRELINAGVDINVVDSLSQTALFYACRDGRTGTVQVMLESGADPTIKDRTRKTAATYAHKQGHKELAVLVRSYADGRAVKDKLEANTPTQGPTRRKYRLQFSAPFDESLWIFAGQPKVEEFEQLYPEIAVWNATADVPHLKPSQDPYMSQWYRLATEIMEELTKYEGSFVFSRPVDSVRWGCPDYYKIVKEPMDLSTIQRRIKSGHYRFCKQFLRDCRLIFSNCHLYNKPDSKVSHIANNLEQYFENLLLRKNFEVWVQRDEQLSLLFNPDGARKESEGTIKEEDEDAPQDGEMMEGAMTPSSSEGGDIVFTPPNMSPTNT